MKNGWMVRAGEGDRLFADFKKGYVAIGSGEVGDITALDTREKMNAFHEEIYNHHQPSRRHNAAAMAHKFRNELSKGDIALADIIKTVNHS
jgi:restriction system protein